MSQIEKYTEFVGREFIEELKILANNLVSKVGKKVRILHVNTTKEGGGVAEILNSLVPLMNDLDLETDWKIFKGTNGFFKFTKKIHNLLHLPTGEKITSQEIALYLRTTYDNFSINTEDYDFVFIHDPQPMGLILKKQKNQKWIWRCHIDTSTPDPKAWDFLKNFIDAYDVAIFHLPEFIQEDIEIKSYIIPPSIDPLHPKNIELDTNFIEQTLSKFNVDPEKPILLQVSRFDRLKDPIGVYKAYRIVKRKYDCQLVLLGSYASDDPEGEEVYKEVINIASSDKDVFILNLPPTSHLEVNAFQRAATVVFQKSIREGFGLVVSEAMFKGKPVIGGNVGGIRRQIVDGVTGFLVNTIEGAAYRAIQLITNKEMRERMGDLVREYVKNRFLITRHLKDYLVLLNRFYD